MGPAVQRPFRPIRPLVGPDHRRCARSTGSTAACATTIGQTLRCIMAPTESANFLETLRQLFFYAQDGNLRRYLLSDEAVQLALLALGPHVSNGRMLDRLPPRPTVADAVASLRLLEHLLRPLAVAPPEADICHAASNGSGVLLAMAAKWSNGTPFLPDRAWSVPPRAVHRVRPVHTAGSSAARSCSVSTSS